MPVSATKKDQPLWFLTNLARIEIDADSSSGTLDIVEMWGTEGEMPPLHLHRREDEYFVVLEGELLVHTSQGSRPVRAGEAAFAPRGVPHTYRIESPQARWLAISNPSGFAAFVADIAEPARGGGLPHADQPPVGLERLDAAAEAAGIEILGPPGTLP